MKYKLQDLIDMAQFQALQDRLNEIYSFPSAIIDNDGNILTATAWQNICTKFHRQNKESEKECIKSDRYIVSHLAEADPAVSYHCPHGLIDNATPIIIEGEHLGNFFTGQFFLEKPDLEFFKKQAVKYGFDQEAYLEAVRRVPIWTKEQLNSYLFFIKGLIEVIGNIGLKHLKSIESGKKNQESEERYRRLYNSTPAMMHSIDHEGRLVSVSDEWLRKLEYTREEVLGRKTTEFLTAESQKYAVEIVLPDFFRTGSCLNVPYQMVTKSGQVLDVLLSATSERDVSGHVLRSLAVIEDISERKKAEEALRESKDQFRKVVENSPLSMALVNSDGVIEYINLKAIETFGYLPQDIPNMDRWWAQAYPDKTYRDEVSALWMRLVGEARTHNHEIEQREYRVTCKNGSVKITEIFGVWIADKVLVVFDDITERKRAEEELREKESKYRILFESANDGIFIQGDNGFIDCNQKGAEMYGLTKEELIGRSPAEFAPVRQPDRRLSSEVAGEKIRAALSGAPQLFEWQPLRADGSPFDVEITLNRLEMGNKIYLQAIVRDISERKQLEQEILKSQKLESIGTLAGGLAHDFNNLLQGVFGYISMAKLTFDQREKSLAMLEQAEKALHQSVNLTTQLLTFSKGGKPVKKSISLGPVIEDSAKFALSGSRINNEIALAEDLWPVDADAGQIGQVIQNIVLNADQAMPEGGTIVISARNVPRLKKIHSQMLGEGNYVEISIQDTGTGIPEKYLQKIFDPYFTTKEKGSGLGLATSYSIIRNHGGQIAVTSESGKGTNFFIYLPAVKFFDETIQKPAASPVVGQKKVLVMDDEDLVLNITGEMIRALGHDVEFARDGESAIEKYRAAMDSGNPFDIVILDLTIRGGMGGRETIEQLLVIDPGARAIVSSGYSADEVLSEYHKYGFKAFLSKPYKIEELRNTLNMLLGP